MTRVPSIHSAVLCFIALLFCVVQAVTCTTYTLGAVYLLSYKCTPSYSAYTFGISAPASASSTASVSYSVSMSSMSNNNGFSMFSAFSTAAGVMTVMGPAGISIIYNMYQSSQLDDSTFVAFGPLSQNFDNSGRTVSMRYESQVYWTMPSEQAQSIGMLMVLAQRELFPASQFMFRYGSIGMGYSAKLLYDILLKGPFGVPYVVYKATSSGYLDSYNTYIATNKPGIVYQYGQSEDNAATGAWNAKLVCDPTLIAINATIAMTFELHYDLLTTYIELADTGVKMLPVENFLLASPVPGVDASEYDATAVFASQVGHSLPAAMSKTLMNFVMAGWVTGWALMQALSMYTGTTYGNKVNFFNNLLGAQSSFVVSDLFMGSFAPPASTCSLTGAAAQQGALCGCHHGGNNIWFHSFAKSGTTYDTTPLYGQLFQYALGKCANLIPPGDETPVLTPYQQLIRTPVPIRVAGLAPADTPMMETMCSQTYEVISLLSNAALYRHVSDHTYMGHCVSTASVSTAKADVATYSSTYVMNSLMGVIADGVSTPSYLVLDYIPQTTQPRLAVANLVYMFTTLDQELYVLASYLRGVTTAASVVCGVVRSSTASSRVAALLKKTLATFLIPVTADDIVQSTTTTLAASIPASCTHTFVVGLDETDAVGLTDYLRGSPSAIVFVSFDDVTKYYTSVTPALKSAGKTVTDRVVFATSLPVWSGTVSDASAAASEAPLSTMEQFLQSVPAELQTPAAVRAYLVAMLYDQLSAGGEPSAGDMQSFLYGNTSWTVAGVLFGPFTTQCLSFGTPDSTGACLFNYGASSIEVWSYTRVLEPATTAVLMGASTPSMTYPITGTAAGAAQPDPLMGEAVDCVSAMSSSMDVPSPIPTTTTTTKLPTTETRHPLPVTASSDDSSSRDTVLNSLMMALGIALCCALAVVVVLLLVRSGVLRPCSRSLQHCCADSKSGRGASQLSVHDDGQPAERAALRGRACDASRAQTDLTQPLTVVCVDVAHYRALWVTVPEVMSLAAAGYERCVREAVVRHGSYEAGAVEGVFVIVCPSPSAGIALARECVERVAELRCDESPTRSMYANLGCGGDEGRGLRLRVGVHFGRVTPRRTGAHGWPRWCCGAAEDAVYAAYCSRTANQVVVTESVRSGLTEAELKALELVLIGPEILPRDGSTTLYGVEPCRRCGDIALDAAPYTHALRVLEAGEERKDVVSTAACLRRLETYFASGRRNMDLLRLLSSAFSLPPVLFDNFPDERAYMDALLQNLCGRVGALLESCHGVDLESGNSARESGLNVLPAPTCGVAIPVVSSASSSARMSRARRCESRRSGKSVVLRHYAYSGDIADM